MPEVQGSQYVEFNLYVPAIHPVQEEDPSPEYVPVAHNKQVVAPVLEYLPVVQEMQEEAPVELEYFPAAQFEQEEAPERENFPVAQLVQEVAPEPENLPAEHNDWVLYELPSGQNDPALHSVVPAFKLYPAAVPDESVTMQTAIAQLNGAYTPYTLS